MNEVFQPASEFANMSASLNKPKKRKGFFRIVLFLIILGLIIFAAFKLFGTSKKSVVNIKPTPTPTIEATPTGTSEASPTLEISEKPAAKATSAPTSTLTPPVTPKVTVNPIDKTTGLNRSKLTIDVQNGSGTAGVGKKAADFLSGLGYVISSTENADNFDYTNVTILIKASQKEFLALLKDDLSASYTVGSSSATLDDAANSDARVIFGK